MNESAGDQVTELLKNDLHLTDPDDLDATDDADEEPPVRTAREGLPGSFRMRHDAHYVDELMSRTDSSPAFEPDKRRRGPVEAAPAPIRSNPPAGIASPASVALPVGSPAAAAALRADCQPPGIACHPLDRPPGSSVHAGVDRPVGPGRVCPVWPGSRGRRRFFRSARRRCVGKFSAGDLADRVTAAGAPVARMGGLACLTTVDDAAFASADSALVVQGLAGCVDAVVDLALANPRGAGRDQSDDRARGFPSGCGIRSWCAALIVDVICPWLFVDTRHAGALLPR